MIVFYTAIEGPYRYLDRTVRAKRLRLRRTLNCLGVKQFCMDAPDSQQCRCRRWDAANSLFWMRLSSCANQLGHAAAVGACVVMVHYFCKRVNV